MEIFPAIDLMGGQAVRLLQGDYHQVTRYSDDPLAVARAFAAQGARFLHVVDLDGAKSGREENARAIARLIEGSGLSVEVGGGIRTVETARRYLQLGAFRVVMGTAALEEGFLRQAVAQLGEHLAVGVDLRDGRVAVRGWTEVTGLEGLQFCQKLEQMGVGTVICTDIARDGALQGTNLPLYARLAGALSRCRVVASGGITRLQEIRQLAGMGVSGAILGRALYTGDLPLEAALAAAGEEG